jgi:hypothetical protein
VTTVKILLAALLLAFAMWGMIRGWRRHRPGPANNWRNEDHASREADGTWAEGSTYTRIGPRDGTGLSF